MEPLGVELVSLDAFPDAPEVEEDQDTLDGNATKKAQELFAHTGIPTIADDTGLEVTALNGAPGVRSARFAGENADDAANRALLIQQLRHADDRRAQFRTVIALATDVGTWLFEGVCRGVITHEERGDGGFGYDPIFLPDGHEDTFAEMNDQTKNSISHRGRALAELVEGLSMDGASS